MGPHFSKFANLHTFFKRAIGVPAASKCRTLEEMLAFLKLKEKKLPLKAKTDCQSLLRVLYRCFKTLTTGKSGLETTEGGETKQRQRSRSRDKDIK